MSLLEILLTVWQVIRDQHKAIIFCQTPGAVTYLFVILSCILRISILQLGPGQTSEQKALVQRTFQKEPKKGMILVTTFGAGCTGWNFQERCHHVHFFEAAYNNATEDQALTRVRRLGNPAKVVYLYHYYIDGTWTSSSAVKNIRKCLPEAAALLNKDIFENVGDETSGEIDIGEWVWCDGQLFDARDPHVVGFGFPILSPIELLTKMMETRTGEFVETS